MKVYFNAAKSTKLRYWSLFATKIMLFDCQFEKILDRNAHHMNVFTMDAIINFVQLLYDKKSSQIVNGKK